MWARRAIPVLAVVATLAGCGGAEIPTPAPASVTPARGFAGNATPVVIGGSGFSVLTVQSSTGGAPTVDETFQAWMGDQALLDVRRIDESDALGHRAGRAGSRTVFAPRPGAVRDFR